MAKLIVAKPMIIKPTTSKIIMAKLMIIKPIIPKPTKNLK